MQVPKIQEKRIRKRLYQKVGKAIQKYGLIDAGDRILVGLSGGKDSFALLDLLAGRRKYNPVKFELAAIHVSLKSMPYQVDVEYLREFAESRNVPFIHETINLDLSAEDANNPCFVCSWNRRKVLFDLASEQGFQKLALGHHMDDAVETLLMNMAFQGTISSMPPALELFDGKLKIIRPLILCSETEVKEYAQISGFRGEVKRCQFEKKSKRKDIRELLTRLTELNPQARTNIFAAMSHVQPEYLPKEPC